MKKLLSVLVIVAMLVTSLSPALMSSAEEGGLALEVTSVTFDPTDRADVLTANVTVSITNNPGVAELNLLAYYDNTQLAVSSITVPTTSMFDDTTLGATQNSTTTANKPLFERAGLTTGTNMKGRLLTFTNEEDNATATGDIVTLKFNIIKDKSTIVNAESFDCGVLIKTATDIDGEDIPLADEPFAKGAITAAVNPLAPRYEEQSFTDFTIYADKVKVLEGTNEVEIGFAISGNNVANNPTGLYSLRAFVVYPRELTLSSQRTGDLFTAKEFDFGITDYDLGNPENVPGTALIEAFTHVGYAYENSDDLVYSFFFDPESETNQLIKDGFLSFATFQLPSTAKDGDKYDIKLAMYIEDVFTYDPSYPDPRDQCRPLPFDWSDGLISVVSDFDKCEHHKTTTIVDPAPTCTEPGLEIVKCDDCSEILSETVIPATGHVETTTTIDPAATCTTDGIQRVTCNACHEVLSETTIPATGHTPGEKQTVVPPTYDADGTYEIRCTVCNEVLETGTIPMLVSTTITAGSVTGKTGTTVKVPVTIDGNTGIFIAALDISFDPSVLTYKNFEIGNVFANTDYVLASNYADGKIRLYFESLADANVTADGAFGYLVFDVTDDNAFAGTNSDIQISTEPMNIVNYAGQQVNCTFEAGLVNVLAREEIAVGNAASEILEEVSVPVTVSNNIGFWGGRLEFSFDTAKLEFVGIDSGLFTAAEGINYSCTDGVITIFVEADSIANVTADGTLFTLKFKTLRVDGDAAINATIIDLVNADEQFIDTFKVSDGTVSIAPCSHAKVTATITTPATIYDDGILSFICDKCGEVVSTEIINKLAGIVIGDLTAKANTSISVPVSLVNNPGVWSIGMQITYDPSVLTFTGLASDLFPANSDNVSVADGVITIFVDAADANADITGDGNAFYLNFDINYDVALGDTSITGTLVADNTINNAKELVTFAIGNSIITVEAHDHIAGPEATCTTDQVCTVCGEILVAKTEHVPGPEATCTQPQICTVCSEILVPALGHTAGEWIVVVHPTELAPGLAELRCTVCGELLDSKEIPYIPFITNLIKGYSAQSVAINDNVITLKAVNNFTEVDFAPVLARGSSIEVVGNVQSIRSGALVYYRTTLSSDASYKLIVTVATGETKEYIVNVEFPIDTTLSITNGWAVKTLNVVDNNIYITSKNNADYVDFAVSLVNTPQSAIKLTNASGAEVAYIYSGLKYLPAYAVDGDNQTFTLTITLANGTVLTYNVYVTFEHSYINSVDRGYFAQSATIEGDVITMITKAGAKQSDFRVNIPYLANVEVVSGNATIVRSGGIYLYSYIQDGATQTYQIKVTLNDGHSKIYTVNVEFK